MNEKGYIAKKLASGGNASSGQSYTGLATNTAKVTVDNASATIKVDVPVATSEQYGVIKIGNAFKLNEDDQLAFSDNYIQEIIEAIPEGGIPVEKIDFEDSVIDANNVDILI